MTTYGVIRSDRPTFTRITLGISMTSAVLMQRHEQSEIRAAALSLMLRFVLLVLGAATFLPLGFLPWIWLDGDPHSMVLQLSLMTAFLFGSGAFLVNGAVTARFRLSWLLVPAGIAFVATAAAALMTPRHAQIDIQTEVNLFSNVSFPTKPEATASDPLRTPSAA